MKTYGPEKIEPDAVQDRSQLQGLIAIHDPELGSSDGRRRRRVYGAVMEEEEEEGFMEQ